MNRKGDRIAGSPWRAARLGGGKKRGRKGTEMKSYKDWADGFRFLNQLEANKDAMLDDATGRIKLSYKDKLKVFEQIEEIRLIKNMIINKKYNNNRQLKKLIKKLDTYVNELPFYSRKIYRIYEQLFKNAKRDWKVD